VKACGEGAVLSHRSAGSLWQILARSDGSIHVMVPRRGGRDKHRGIRVHRSSTLLPSQCTLRHAIPVTTPARTLEDLHRSLSATQFAAALRRAEYLGLPIGGWFAPDRSHSELESRFLALCRRHRLPRPEVNARVGRFLVDFLWREHRLVVETDGYRFHRGRTAFEGDRQRDVQLKLLGYEVVRFTHRQVVEQGPQVARALRALLAQQRRLVILEPVPDQ
jgi:very-short-patch-repair endonuclease